MPKILNPFVFQQPGEGTDNYIDGGPTRAGLEGLRSKLNLAPYVFATVAQAQAATYSEPESVVVVETGLLYFYDPSSSETVDGFYVLSTGGAGRLLARKKSYGCAQVSVSVSTGTLTAGTPINIFENCTIVDSSVGSVDFTVDDTNKRLTYTGAFSKKAKASLSVSLSSSQKDIILSIFLYKNGSLLDPYGAELSIDVIGDIHVVSLCDHLLLNNNDYFEIFADISAGTTTITPESGAVLITEI